MITASVRCRKPFAISYHGLAHKFQIPNSKFPTSQLVSVFQANVKIPNWALKFPRSSPAVSHTHS